jgi:hypothetical protein
MYAAFVDPKSRIPAVADRFRRLVPTARSGLSHWLQARMIRCSNYGSGASTKISSHRSKPRSLSQPSVMIVQLMLQMAFVSPADVPQSMSGTCTGS